MRVVKRSGLAAAAALTLGAGVLIAAPAYAAPVTTIIDGITYEADDADVAAVATATAFDGSTTTVDIPDTVTIGGDDYDVVAIDASVFRNASLTGVTLGENVATIGILAFQQNNLGSVTIPDSVTTIGQNAFGFTHLTDLTLGNSVATIEYGAFSSNPLTSVTIPDSVSTIGGHAFMNNSALTSVVFTGAAPTVDPVASATQTFDTSSGTLVLSYQWAYDASNVAGGFTTPTWMGYDTRAIGDDVPSEWVSITKTVDASFVRVYDWEFEKTGTVGEITVGDADASADVDFTVTATPNGYTDDYYLLTGHIMVTNEIVEPMTVTVTDEPDIGVDATCAIVNSEGEPASDLRLSPNESVILDYYCNFAGTPENGTNTATVSWGGDASASVTEDVVFTQRDTSFETITVGDDHAKPDDEYTELGIATWNSDHLPFTSSYTLTKENLPLGECTSMTNTAMIYEMERTAQATVEICPEAAAVTPDPEVTPAADDHEPVALAQTGVDFGGGHMGLALLLMLAGGAAVLVTHRTRIRIRSER